MLRSHPAPQRFCMILTQGPWKTNSKHKSSQTGYPQRTPATHRLVSDYNKLREQRGRYTAKYNYDHLEIVASVYLETGL